MKKILLIGFVLFVALTLFTGCSQYEGNEYSASVVGFIVKESKDGFSIDSFEVETSEGEITVKFKNVDYESMNVEATRVTSISAGKYETTLNVKSVELVFKDGESVVLEVNSIVDIVEIRRNVWTIER